MSATDQFPPRHLISDEDSDQAGKGEGNADSTASGLQHEGERLALPSAPANEEKARQLDVASGGRVALDELGPMVVNKDGTLSRIHNWASMTENERANTLRVLGKRNQLRMADLRGETEAEEQGQQADDKA
ncbi:hypothetical protein BDZ90DRAFT_233435 [Jaminaea rosea]|uniref:Uncharacterized protein n=1 Tax=Jaminaea rosea TaxID=1569628 RepID=A0A316UPN0_9BASI|nr:hypothetical protein BDZ90DRAFT_233435 [Jaminaea rosea]PWN26301.1 hypothetical protein BDZ90DRAFT_233435 [Jaminaea rosea]